MAKPKSTVVDPVSFTPIEEPPPLVTEALTSSTPSEESRKPIERLPDIREMKSINLGPDRNSPRLRLLRNYRFNQMQIRSDEALPQASRDQLKDAGWTERPNEGVWTKQLPRRSQDGEGDAPKPAWPTVVEAERLFHELANAIRADKGMAPIGPDQGAGSGR